MAGRNKVAQAGHSKSKPKEDFCTPEFFLDLVRDVIGDIDLDPASNPKSIVNAKYTIMLPHHQKVLGLTDLEALDLGIIFGDGLALSWAGHSVYTNPPFSRKANKLFAEKIHREGLPRIGGPEEKGLIALVPSSPGTKWFQETYANAAALCFWQGRITYREVPPNEKSGRVEPADFENAVIYYGTDTGLFKKVFGPHGWIP